MNDIKYSALSIYYIIFFPSSFLCFPHISCHSQFIFVFYIRQVAREGSVETCWCHVECGVSPARDPHGSDQDTPPPLAPLGSQS